MNYEAFRKNNSKKFLGFCDELQSFIYSVQVDENEYSVVALRNAEVTVLITYKVHQPQACQ
ncbi:hypothetical protein PAE9249_03885 [Paenibacillus sp. CECT 9249]|uniref:hypothetical protein n=1 Tax=Paenibacillus sp. CECT 9249 TaxID=2845385 RepID=UPI001E438AD6|nr:hypothetical protein [Paenibacillus sp. CECT 9249]CAH0121358.1 hypothetical protein PAE9249_03885 [Paenibacillus sp. CECT 9249]